MFKEKIKSSRRCLKESVRLFVMREVIVLKLLTMRSGVEERRSIFKMID